MKTAKDFGYNSWSQMYDYLKEFKPEFFQKNNRLIFQHMDKNKKITQLKITRQTLERYCWQELQDFRIDTQQIHAALYVISTDSRINQNTIIKLQNLFDKIAIY